MYSLIIIPTFYKFKAIMKIDFHDKIDYINKYTTPVMNVVAVEVKKDEVDNVYMELKVAIDNNIVED